MYGISAMQCIIRLLGRATREMLMTKAIDSDRVCICFRFY